MFKTFTKINKSKLTKINQNSDKNNRYAVNKQVLNIQKYEKSSKNLRKTSNNFKINLSLTPIYDEITLQSKPVNIRKKNFAFFGFNKAPSIKDNSYKINKLVKIKRSQYKSEIAKVHSKILISESELYRNKLYITASDINPNNKFNLIKSNSCRALPTKNKKVGKIINKVKTFRTSNNFYTKSTNNNSVKNLGISILKNKQILSALKKDDTEKETDYALKAISKMKMQLIDTLQNEFDPKKLSNSNCFIISKLGK